MLQQCWQFVPHPAIQELETSLSPGWLEKSQKSSRSHGQSIKTRMALHVSSKSMLASSKNTDSPTDAQVARTYDLTWGLEERTPAYAVSAFTS